MSKSANTLPTAVLVHGARSDGSSWSKVTRDLQARGFRIVAAQRSGPSATTASPCASPMNGTMIAASGFAATATRTGNSTRQPLCWCAKKQGATNRRRALQENELTRR